MKAVILFRPNSDHTRIVEEYVRDFQRRFNRDIQLVSLDTTEGARQAELYDITQYPAVLAVKDDGQLVQLWQGPRLPLANEVVGYLVQT